MVVDLKILERFSKDIGESFELCGAGLSCLLLFFVGEKKVTVGVEKKIGTLLGKMLVNVEDFNIWSKTIDQVLKKLVKSIKSAWVSDHDQEKIIIKSDELNSFVFEKNTLHCSKLNKNRFFTLCEALIGNYKESLKNNIRLRDFVLKSMEDKVEWVKTIGDTTFVVLQDKSDPELEEVKIWEDVFDDVYTEESDNKYNGWNSSLTNKPYTEKEMDEWVHSITTELNCLNPRRVLEIGVGQGLLLDELYENCEFYVGTDLSKAVVEKLQRRNLTKLTALGIPAHEPLPKEFEQVKFDLIILNSVMQYFPSLQYLEKVILLYQDYMAPGGTMFLGDINNKSLEQQLVEQIKIGRGLEEFEHTEELKVHPKFFLRIAKENKDLFANCLLLLHRGEFLTEMNKFRYNAILKKCDKTEPKDDEHPLIKQGKQHTFTWNNNSWNSLYEILNCKKYDEILIKNIPNRRISTTPINGTDRIDPENLIQEIQKYGVFTKLLVSVDEPECFDIICIKQLKQNSKFYYKNLQHFELVEYEIPEAPRRTNDVELNEYNFRTNVLMSPLSGILEFCEFKFLSKSDTNATSDFVHKYLQGGISYFNLENTTGNEIVELEIPIRNGLLENLAHVGYCTGDHHAVWLSLFNIFFAYYLKKDGNIGIEIQNLEINQIVPFILQPYPWFLNFKQFYNIIRQDLDQVRLRIRTSMGKKRRIAFIYTNTEYDSLETGFLEGRNILIVVNPAKRIIKIFHPINKKHCFKEMSIHLLSFMENLVNQEMPASESIHSTMCRLLGNSLPSISTNDISAEHNKAQNLSIKLQEVAKTFPINPAVIENSKIMTYETLNSYSSRLAGQLTTMYSSKEYVLIYQETGIDFLVSVFGTLQAGKVVITIDTRSNKGLIETIIQDTDPLVLLHAQSKCNWEALTIPTKSVVLLDEIMKMKDINSHIEESPAIIVRENEIGFLFYTSGTTGKPKPVLCTQKGYTNLVNFLSEKYSLNPEDKSIFHTSPGFDASILEYLPILLSGGTVFVLPPEIRENMTETWKWSKDQGLTILQASTFLAEEFYSLASMSPAELLPLPQMRLIIFGGESPKTLPKLEMFPSCEFAYAFGLTETAVACIFSTFTMSKNRPILPIPIGKPISNCFAFVLDEFFYTVPDNVVGEIYIGGECLSTGCLDRHITSTKFITINGLKLFRTGDLGFRDLEGNLNLVGRNDSQYKIRGVRFDLLGLETIVQENPSVHACAIVLKNDNLHIFCTLKNQNYTKDELYEYVLKYFPSFIFPSSINILDTIPININGKIDRQKLEQLLIADKQEDNNFENELEYTMSKIWKTILGVSEEIRRNDNFLMLGGNSFRIMQLVGYLRKLGYSVQPRDVILHPNLYALSEFCSKSVTSITSKSNTLFQETTMKEHSESYKYPLSRAQLQVWTHTKLYSRNPLLYIESCIFEFDQAEGLLGYITEGVNFIRKKQHILQSLLHTDTSGIPFWEYKQQELQNELPLSLINDRSQLNSTLSFQRKQLEKINFNEQTILQGWVIEISTENKILLHLIFHHLLLDNISIMIFEKELRSFIQCKLQKSSVDLEPLPPNNYQYKDYVEDELKNANKIPCSTLKFWEEYTKDIRSIDLPRKGKFSEFDEKVAKNSGIEIDIEPEVYNNFLKFVHSHGVSAFSIILTAVNMLLKYYTGNDKNAILIANHGRNYKEFENLLGHFVQLSIMKTVEIDGVDTFENISSRVSQSMFDIFNHLNISLEEVLERMSNDETKSIDFYPLAITFIPKTLLHSSHYKEYCNEKSKFDLLLTLIEGNDRIKGLLEYSSTYNEAFIRQFAQHFIKILKSSVQDPSVSLDSMNISTPEELNEINKFTTSCLQSTPEAKQRLEELFKQSALKHSDNIAVMENNKTISYYQLLLDANNLAKVFCNLLNPQDECIILVLPQGINFITTVLGALIAGKTIIPLNEDVQRKKLKCIIEQSKSKLVIVQDDHMKRKLIDLHIQICNIQMLEKFSDGNATLDLETLVSKSHIAYVLFTSGSTGEPKGVLITHDCYLTTIQWFKSYFNIKEIDRMLGYTSVTFDLSLMEYWPILLSGGTLSILPSDIRHSMDDTRIWVKNNQITIVNMSTSLAEEFMNATIDSFSSSLRHLNYGGEVPKTKPNNEIKFKVASVYGLTETGCINTINYIDSSTTGSEFHCVGSPISNGCKILVLNPKMKQMPCWITGEIYIGGKCISPGYLNNQNLNSNAFITINNTIYLHTKDLGYWRSDGKLVIQGRIDSQVKIRGLRVNMDELEGLVESYPGISSCVILVLNSKCHVLVTLQKNSAINQENLMEYMTSNFPQYIPPSSMNILDSFPRTVSGKIDKKELEKCISTSQDDSSESRQLNGNETLLAKIWETVLNVPFSDITPIDNFFGLGGNSFRAVRVSKILRGKGYQTITPGSVFKYPVLQSFSKIYLESQALNYSSNLSNNENLPGEPGTFKLSLPQEMIWLHQQKYPENPFLYIESYVIEFDRTESNISVADIMTNIDKLAKRHDLLHSELIENNSIPRWKIIPEDKFTVTTKLIHSYETEVELNDIIKNNRYLPFFNPQLINYFLITSGTKYYLQLVFSHLIMDYIGIQIYETELMILLRYNTMKTLPPSKYTFKEFVSTDTLFETRNTESRNEFWNKFLKNTTKLELPKYDSSTHVDKHIKIKFPKGIGHSLQKLSAQLGTTTFSVMYSTFSILMNKYSNSKNLLVLLANNGREEIGTENILGNFVHIVPLKTWNESKVSNFSQFNQRVFSKFALIMENMSNNFADLVSRLPKHLQDEDSLYQLGFSYIPNNNNRLVRNYVTGTSKCKLLFTMIENDDEIEGIIEHTTQYPDLLIEDMGKHLIHLLETFLKNPETSVADNLFNIDNLPNLDRIEPVNANSRVENLILNSCVNYPDNIAVIENNERITYRELAETINNLSNTILNFKLDNFEYFIVVLLPPSKDLIISVLSSFSSGFPWITIDPTSPEFRIATILKDIRNWILLTTTPVFEGLKHLLDGMGNPYIFLDKIVPTKPLNLTQIKIDKKNDVSYMIYTSGTTGTPKGVVLSHGTVHEYVAYNKEKLKFSSDDRSLFFTTGNFDANIIEYLLALSVGGTVLPVPESIRFDFPEIIDYVKNNSITYVNMTTKLLETFYKGYMDKYSDEPTPLRVVTLGGEPTQLKYPVLPSTTPLVVNIYGLTESTVGATFDVINETAAFPTYSYHSSVGTPRKNCRIYIMNQELQSLPRFVAGEIIISGNCLALEYYKRNELSHKTFVAIGNGKKGLRTGDKGFLDQYGRLHMRGRLDDQIKIRGVRLYLSEIETYVRECPIVESCTAIYHKDGLHIFCTMNQELPLDEGQEIILEFLSRRLPTYITPNSLRIMDRIPTNINGKVDKLALEGIIDEELGHGRNNVREESPLLPLTPEEIIVTQALRKILSLNNDQKLPINSSIFLFGMNSHYLITFLKYIKSLKEIDSKLTIVTIFKNPTIKKIAERIKVKSHSI